MGVQSGSSKTRTGYLTDGRFLVMDIEQEFCVFADSEVVEAEIPDQSEVRLSEHVWRLRMHELDDSARRVLIA